MKKLTKLLLALVIAIGMTHHAKAENYPYRSDVLWLTVPNNSNWLYKLGEKATVEIGFYKYGIPRDAVVNYAIGPDMRPAETKGSVKLKKGKGSINLGTMKKPGFKDCVLTTSVDGKTYTHHVKVGFAPEQLKPYTKNPDDFDDFWTKNINDIQKLPLSFTKEKVEKYCTDEFDCYLVKLRVDKQGHHVYAYLTMPKKPGKYPVVLCPPGAGIKTIKEPMKRTYYVKNGFIRMEMEIHGLNPEISTADFSDISKAFNTTNNAYLENGLDNRDNYYMKHVYQACVRCIDYLVSLDEWDGKNVIVQGGSQGGALAIVTAGLDKRVTQCVANHPALSDMAGYLGEQCGGYPHFNRSNQMLTPEKVKTMQYYDVVNFARRVKAETYITWGYNDNVCPPTTSYIVYNLINAPKEALITPINEHWTSDDTEYGQMLWIKKRLK